MWKPRCAAMISFIKRINANAGRSHQSHGTSRGGVPRFRKQYPDAVSRTGVRKGANDSTKRSRTQILERVDASFQLRAGGVYGFGCNSSLLRHCSGNSVMTLSSGSHLNQVRFAGCVCARSFRLADVNPVSIGPVGGCIAGIATSFLTL
jgi:hypothetical protein